MKTESDSGYAKVGSKFMRWFLRSPLGALISHWFFQSLFYMDPTERWFKLTLDLVLTLASLVLLTLWLPWQVALLIAFIFAHTLNFLFNGHLWGVLKHYSLINQDSESFNQYVQALKLRASSEPSIKNLFIFGSLSRQEWSPHSDFDARIIRYPGFLNGARACWFLLKERTRALFTKFPLDIYILDSPRSLDRLHPDETALDLLKNPGE